MEEIMGTNVSTTYITCPADPSKTLGIKLPFLATWSRHVGMPFRVLSRSMAPGYDVVVLPFVPCVILGHDHQEPQEIFHLRGR